MVIRDCSVCLLFTVQIACRAKCGATKKNALQSKAPIPQLKLFAWTPPSLLTIDCAFVFERVPVLTGSRNRVLVVDVTSVSVL